MVQAYKVGSYDTTPLRICMNSSMKLSLPSGVSLNDYLPMINSPTDSICEHKIAFTEDILNFYQCVAVDEAVCKEDFMEIWRQLSRAVRIHDYQSQLWRQACRTYRYSCVSGKAARFAMGKEEASWFLTYRMYMDDATGGAYDKNNALKISQDMEDIKANGDFHFKETVMTSNLLGETRSF
jgi:hypothetical protein